MVSIVRIAIVATLLAISATSQAAPNDGDRATARALFEEARELMREQRFDEACPKLEASRDIVPGVGILFNLAECYEGLGKNASAWSLYRDVAAQLSEIGDTQREAVARERAAALAPKLSTLRIDVAGAPEGAVVKRADRDVPASQWGEPVPVDPGTYAIEASAPGRVPWHRDVVVKAEGDAAMVNIELAVTPVTKTVPPVVRTRPLPPLPPELQPPDGRPVARAIGWVLTVGGAAFTAVGFGLYGAGVDQIAESEDRCQGNRDGCSDVEAVELGEDGLDLQRTGLPMGIAGASALLAGVITLAVYAPDASNEQPTATVALTPGGARARLSW
jgi:hypothetical protein